MPTRRGARRALAHLVNAVLLLASGGPAAASDDDARRALVEQKLRLVDMLVQSANGKGGTAEGDRSETADKRRQALEQARQALAAGRLADAERSLDAVLARSTRSAPAGAHARPLGDSAIEAGIRNLEQQLASYRATLSALAQGDSAAAAAARTLLARVDQVKGTADQLASAGDRRAAHERLRDGYRLIVEGLARIQAGQTVVLSLKFDTPADEYAYEQRRFQSNDLLVRMMLGDMGREGDVLRKQVEPFTAKAERLRGQAEGRWASNDQTGAIALLEKASAQLNRALQTLGVPAY